MVIFDSASSDSLEAITGDSPDDLVKNLKALPGPITILAIVPMNARHVAYVVRSTRKLMQEITPDKYKKPKNKKEV